MKHIIIDCDPGHDDAVAIFMALAHKEAVVLRAVTTVCGNNTLENITRNAQMVLDTAGANTILAAGAERPLVGRPIISSQYHGPTGMNGPTILPPATHPIDPRHAVEVMRDILSEGEEKITIAALGPLTNLALLIRTYPGLLSKIEAVSLMGGGLRGGNTTPHAEFNICVDPEAAEIVFGSGLPIIMSGLDVTTKAVIYPKDYEHLKQGSSVGRFFVELMEFYIRGAHDFGADGCIMHDPCAIAYLLRPEMFHGIHTGVCVELCGEKRGKTVAAKSDRTKVLVLQEVDTKEMSKLVIESIEKLAQIEQQEVYP